PVVDRPFLVVLARHPRLPSSSGRRDIAPIAPDRECGVRRARGRDPYRHGTGMPIDKHAYHKHPYSISPSEIAWRKDRPMKTSWMKPLHSLAGKAAATLAAFAVL